MRTRFAGRLSTLEESPVALDKTPAILPTILDPYEDFKHPEWAKGSTRRTKTYRIPDSINLSRKRKIGPLSKKVVSPIYCFLSGRKYDPDEDPFEEHEWHILEKHKEEEQRKKKKIWREMLAR